MPFFDFKKKKIFYHLIEKNTQQAMIFIHGAGESSYIWKNQMNDLIHNHSLIALDLPSHGKSSDLKKISIERYVDAIKALVEHLHLKKVILIGHSLGGAIAQTYYFQYREDVAALILCATGARLRVSPMIFESIQKDYSEFLEMLPIGVFYRKTSKNIIDDFVEEMAKSKPEVVYQDFIFCNEFDMLKKVRQIRVPCLIICGNADKLTPLKYSQFLEAKIRNSILITIKNAGHMVMLEKSEEVNQVIQDFLKNKKL